MLSFVPESAIKALLNSNASVCVWGGGMLYHGTFVQHAGLNVVSYLKMSTIPFLLQNIPVYHTSYS
jgi:hypothetical protein